MRSAIAPPKPRVLTWRCRAAAEQAVDPSHPGYIERDDFALEIANMDE